MEFVKSIFGLIFVFSNSIFAVFAFFVYMFIRKKCKMSLMYFIQKQRFFKWPIGRCVCKPMRSKLFLVMWYTNTHVLRDGQWFMYPRSTRFDPKIPIASILVLRHSTKTSMIHRKPSMQASALKLFVSTLGTNRYHQNRGQPF